MKRRKFPLKNMISMLLLAKNCVQKTTFLAKFQKNLHDLHLIQRDRIDERNLHIIFIQFPFFLIFSSFFSHFQKKRD